jgi:hypothetical protein
MRFHLRTCVWLLENPFFLVPMEEDERPTAPFNRDERSSGSVRKADATGNPSDPSATPDRPHS